MFTRVPHGLSDLGHRKVRALNNTITSEMGGLNVTLAEICGF